MSPVLAVSAGPSEPRCKVTEAFAVIPLKLFISNYWLGDNETVRRGKQRETLSWHNPSVKCSLAFLVGHALLQW